MNNKIEKDFIDDLIRELKKKPDLCVMTTYEFDVNFFETYLLKNLPENTYLIVDRGMFSNINDSPSSRFLSKMKNKIIYINLPKGVFHPKIVLLVKDGVGTVYVSSANVTGKGYMKNEEFIVKFNESYAVANVIRFISRLLTKHGVGSASKNLLKYLKSKKFNFDVPSDVSFIDNIDTPIFNQLEKYIKRSSINEIYIISPYLDNNFSYLIKLLNEWTNGAKIFLVLQRNVNCYDPSLVNGVVRLLGGFKDRFLHSKIIYFRGEKDIILSGSANFTTKALLNSSDDGNVEFDVLLFLSKNSFMNYLKYLNLADVEDIKILNFEKEMNKPSIQQPPVLVISCYFEDGKVYIEFTGDRTKETKIKIYDSNDNLFSEPKDSDIKFNELDNYKLLIISGQQFKDDNIYKVEFTVGEYTTRFFFTTHEEFKCQNVEEYTTQLILNESDDLWIPIEVIEQTYNHILGRTAKKRHNSKLRYPLFHKDHSKKSVNVFRQIIRKIRDIRIKEIESNIDPRNETNEIDENSLIKLHDLIELLLDSSVDLVDKKLHYEDRITILWNITNELSELERICLQVENAIITKKDLSLWETYFLYLYALVWNEQRFNIREDIIGNLLNKLHCVIYDELAFLDMLKETLSTSTFRLLEKKGVFNDLNKIFREFDYIKHHPL